MKSFNLLLLICFINVAEARSGDNDSKKLEKLKQKHELWERCTLISNGGTIPVRIKSKEEYAKIQPEGVLEVLPVFNGFAIAYDSEKEKHISADDFTALIIPSKGKFISLKITEAGVVKYELFKVLVDGRRQLLFREYAAVYNKRDEDSYYVCYNNAIWFFRSEEHDKELKNKSPATFRKKCGEVFSECPSLMQEIENKDLKLNNLPEIINEFNRCINETSQEKK